MGRSATELSLSSIRELYLENSYFTRGGISHLVRCRPQLESFVYREDPNLHGHRQYVLGLSPGGPVEKRALQPVDLVATVKPVRGSLKHFEMDLYGFMAPFVQHKKLQPCWWRDFAKLEVVSVPLRHLECEHELGPVYPQNCQFPQ
ncbi:Uu.00g051300.m01.CDS01 [Anthostomella pinea]|uniref:Uu.00g051300.m01.CDS01 n=1 Tax=Anthostomella pinea TaxID=933095 RepID=A0AAI8YMP6_9PEZI|nr:Uu.00g051300.m01.CDS01 [Anthostomella pinea]